MSAVIIQRYNASTDELAGHEAPLDDELCQLISRRNTYLKPEQVREALTSGQRVYTSLSYYARKVG